MLLVWHQSLRVFLVAYSSLNLLVLRSIGVVAGSGETESLFESLRSQLLPCFVQLLTVLCKIPKAFKAALVSVKLRAEALKC